MAVLGELELRIMRVLWSSNEPLLVRDVQERLRPEKELAYTTVMTVLDRLSKKDKVSRTQDGRAWAYVPACTQATLIAEEMVSLLEAAEGEDKLVLGELVDRLTPEQFRHLELLVSALTKRSN